MNISEDCQCEEDQLAVLEWTKHVLEETLIPVVGTVGLLGNTLTILVLNRYHIAQGDHFKMSLEFTFHILNWYRHMVNKSLKKLIFSAVQISL